MDKILVIGDIILDNYLIGGCSRISPEAPVQVINITQEKSVLGGAGNVINNILSLGGNADILSVVGNCDNTKQIRELLKTNKIDDKYLIVEKNRFSSKKTRIIAEKQQVLRCDKETAKDILKSSETELLNTLKQIINNYKIIVLSDYGKGVLTNSLTQNIINLADDKVKVLVDPKGKDWSKYYGAYLLTPNKNEAELATNEKINKDNLVSILAKIKEKVGLTKSIITLSADGIAVFDTNMRIHPTTVKEVYDVSGAGDTVIASIAIKLIEKDDIDEAIVFANLAARVVVGKIGTATATLDEIYHHQHSIKKLKQIVSIVQSLKQNGKKIVFTNGCFDILHLGHIKYLEEAKKLGDILIVAINTDSSVKRLKGKSRPINPEFDRAYLVGALKAVDYVVLFDEETPYELIKNIEPDLLVKGADYHNKDIVGSDMAKSTHLIEFIKDKSTTNIIRKIQND